MSDMVPSGSKYSDSQRKEAIVMYAIEGVGSVVSKATGVPESTLCNWLKTDWANDLLTEVRSANDSRHIAQYSKIVDEAHKITLEKLPEATAAQASIIAATATDKARLLLNIAPPSSTGGEGIKELKAQFEALSQSHKRIEGTIVDEQ